MAALNTPFLLLLLLAITTLFLHTTTAATIPASPPDLVGGYTLIRVDPYVENLAKFAIEEHNKQKNDHLVYSKTMRAERQVVNGYNYRLIISAYRDHEKPHNYEAVVYVPISGAKRLTSFKNLLQTATTEATATAVSASPRPPRTGQFMPIPNAQNNTLVQKLGRFAVQEYNDKFNIGRNLTFSAVEQAAYQIVAGTNYYLYLYAIEKGFSTELRFPFDVYVYEALSGVKTLTSFKRHLLKAR